MKAETSFVGARGIDSLPFSQSGTAIQADALASSGIDFVIGYLGAMTAERVEAILDAGLAFMPVTFAGEYADGADDEVIQLRALRMPQGITVWLDLEGLDAYHSNAPELMARLTNWANKIIAAGFKAGLYVGAPQPLTSSELYALPFTRYWLGIGRCVDRNGNDAYPSCGWCMRQDWHGQKMGMMWKGTGVFVDTNHIQCDHRGRLPVWCVR